MNTVFQLYMLKKNFYVCFVFTEQEQFGDQELVFNT